MSEIIVALAGRLAVVVLRRLPFRAVRWLEARAGTTSLWNSIVATAFVLKSGRRRSARRAAVTVFGAD